MSQVRGLGRRERVARNRHRRCVVHTCGGGSESRTYKLGRKKRLPNLFRSLKASGSATRDDREVAHAARVAEVER